MTDKEYINGFFEHKDSVITDFYLKRREKFCSYFMKKYHKDEDYAKDLFSDSIMTLQRNIEKRKLTPDGLTSSLNTYLYAIGHRTLWAQDRKMNVLEQKSLDDAPVNNDGEPLISREILEAIRSQELDELVLNENKELEDYVDRMVHSMTSPCSEILDMFYWGKKAMEEIAEKLNFSNARSAITQKYKCMEKLKPLVTGFRDALR